MGSSGPRGSYARGSTCEAPPPSLLGAILRILMVGWRCADDWCGAVRRAAGLLGCWAAGCSLMFVFAWCWAPSCGSTSTATMRANQLRLWFASMAYVLLCALRRIALHHTPFAKATCGTIRLKLLKIGALVRVSVRRIKVAMASACPAADAWGCAAKRLAAAANARASPA